MRLIVVACAPLVLSLSLGCLNNPDSGNFLNAETNGTENSTVGPTTNNNTNNANNENSSTSDQACDGCALGETRCTEDAFEECVSSRDEEGLCHVWETVALCQGAQSCHEDDGCVCSTTCEPTGQVECLPDAAFVCMMVDGCPRSVRIDRNSDCDPPETSALNCDENPGDPFCAPCADGRSCTKLCPGTELYGCGTR